MRLILCFGLLIQIYANKLGQIQNPKENSCLRQLLTNYKIAEWEVIVTNMDINAFVSRRTINLEENELVAQNPEPPLFYVLQIENDRVLSHFYRHLENRYFQSTAKFLFVGLHLTDIRVLVKTLLKHYISTVVFVDWNFNVYAVSPFKYESLDQPEVEPFRVGTCAEVSLFLNRSSVYPKFWRNTSLNVYIRPIKPYATKEMTGIEVWVLMEIAKHLGIRVVPVMGEEEFQGTKENGLYENKGLDLLLKNEVQIILGGYTASPQFYKDFDSSVVYYIGSTTIFAPKALQKSGWIRLLNPLGTKALIGFIGFGVVWVILVRVSTNHSTFTIALIYFMISFQSAIPNLLGYKINRIALCTLLLGAVLLTAIALSLYQSTYYTISYEKETHSISDINLPVIVPRDVFDSFRNSESKEDQNLFSRMAPCTTAANLCLSKVCHSRSAVLISPRMYMMEKALNVCFNSLSGEYQFHLGQDVDSYYAQMYFSRGLPAKQAINDVIVRFVIEGGIAAKEERDKIHIKSMSNMGKTKLKSKSVVWDNLPAIFSLLLVGVVAACISFLVEILSVRQN